jgi:FkbM family methyltransferase
MLKKIENYILACCAMRRLNLKGCPFLPKAFTRLPIYNRSRFNTFITWIKILQLGQARWMVDAGANHGDFSHAASACFPSARCLLVEPLPQLHGQLEKRCNGSREHWFLEKCALGATNCVMPFYVARSDEIGSLAGFSEEYAAVIAGAKPSSQFECQVRTLDAVAAQHGIAAIDLLKIDVEGFEFEVLEGAREALAKTEAVIVEVSLVRNPSRHSSALLRMLNLLADAGFDIVRVIPSLFDRREPWKPVEFNILARRST